MSNRFTIFSDGDTRKYVVNVKYADALQEAIQAVDDTAEGDDQCAFDSAEMDYELLLVETGAELIEGQSFTFTDPIFED